MQHDIELRKYPNEHGARIEDPKQFDRIRRKNNHFKDGIHVLFGFKNGKSKVQSIRFDKDMYTPAQAKQWLRDHDFKWIEFAPASGEKHAEDLMIETRVLKGMELEDRAEKDGLPKIKGYATKYNVRSKSLGGFVEVIKPETFKESISDDDVRALVEHDPSKILGRNKAGTLKLANDASGLRAEIVPPNTQAGRDVVESIRRGDLDGMSIGFRVKPGGDSWAEDDDGLVVRTLTAANLVDVSVVAYPAYPQTSVAVRSMNEWMAQRAAGEAGAEAKNDADMTIRRQLVDAAEQSLGT